MNTIEKSCVDTIRVVCADAITKAKSGHPGIALGAAPIMHTLYTKFMNVNPNDSKWFDRDRFILSAGHGSALLYMMLHLSGYKVTIDDLANFRQKGSITPGHPEYRHTDGVEMTTGPLGQGIATAVGMAISEKFLANKYNKKNHKIVDHNTYVLCGDGDLQEGITQEAMSLAGHLKLSKLVLLYDSNDIQLDGAVSLAISEDVKGKYEAMGWQYIFVDDGNDISLIEKAIQKAKASSDKPTIVEIKTVIGHGAPNCGGSGVHGKPLSEGEVTQLRECLGYDTPKFTVCANVYDYYIEHVKNRGIKTQENWEKRLASYAKENPNEYDEFMAITEKEFSVGDISTMPKYGINSKVSTRVVMGDFIDWLNNKMPNTIGGSADLTPSTMVKGADGDFEADNLSGRNIRFGVREHAMAAITNGITLHGGLRSFCAGFFVFSDYMKPAIRLAAIMKINSLFFFSHDTICVGEDGPTHQPVEQLTMMRSIPNLNTFRPADANEMQKALVFAFDTKDYPTIIVSTRQNLPTLEVTANADISKGAYIAYEPNGKVEGIIITCGSELMLAIDVAKKLEAEGKFVRIVSMPSFYLFENQSNEYKEMILPKSIDKRLAVEMGSSMPWYKYSKEVFGLDTFGASMPITDIYEAYGFTVENIYNIYKKI